MGCLSMVLSQLALCCRFYNLEILTSKDLPAISAKLILLSAWQFLVFLLLESTYFLDHLFFFKI